MNSPGDSQRIMSAGLWVIPIMVVIAWACGTSTPTNPPPPAVTNAPPVIQSVAVSAVRVEAGGDVQLTATVTDAETPVSQLVYAWSASPITGSFTGTGSTVTWHAPASAMTPTVVTFTVVVTESFTSAGQAKT